MTLFALTYGFFFITYGVYYLRGDFVDYPTFHAAARVVFVERESPYEPGALESQRTDSGQTIFPFLYPPPALLATYPLAHVSQRAGGVALLLANHVVLLFLLLFVSRRILGLEVQEAVVPVAIVYTFLFHPLAVTLGNGQIGLFVLLFICWFWAAYKGGSRPSVVAFPLAVAVILKSYPAILLAYLLVKRRFVAIGWTLLYVAGLSALSYVTLPDTVWLEWLREVLPTGGYGETPLGLFSPAGPWNQSINGFTSRLFLENEFSEALLPSAAAARIVPYALSGLIVATSMWLCFRAGGGAGEAERTDLEVSLFLLAMFLLAPLSWEHHLVFVLPSTVVAFRVLMGLEKLGWAQVMALLALLVLAWRFPAWSGFLREGFSSQLISLKFYAVCCLWLFFVTLLRTGSEGGDGVSVMDRAPGRSSRGCAAG